MKRALALGLALTLAVSLAGCKTEEKKGSVSADIPYEIGDPGGLDLPFGNGETIKMFAVDATQSTSNYIFDKASEITGVNLVVDRVPVSTYQEKVKVIMASKNLPDIIGDGFKSYYEINDYATQGAFTSVNDHIGDMPNFKRIFNEEDNKWVWKALAAGDGKLYAMPAYEVNSQVTHGMMYRKDIFDKYGIKMWDSPETFYQALKKLKEADPNCYPFASKNQENLITAISYSWGIKGFYPYFDEDKKEWFYSDTSDQMKDLLDFLRKLYAEELVDPEFLTATQADWTAKMTTNKSYVTYDWIARMAMFGEQSTIPGYDLRFGNPIGPKQTNITPERIFRILTVVPKGKNEDVAMKYMDFLYSDAGAKLFSLGIKGETYEEDENGNVRYLGFPEDKKVMTTDLQEKYGMMMQGTYRTVDKRCCSFMYTEKEQEAIDLIVGGNKLEPEDPCVAMSGDVQSKAEEIRANLSQAFKEMMFKYIIGTETGDEVWAKWKQQAKNLGEDEMIKIYNDCYKAMGL